MLMPFFSPPGISLEQVVSFQIDCKSLMAGALYFTPDDPMIFSQWLKGKRN